MGSLVEHAKREFKAAGWDKEDGMQEHINANLLELLEAFANQGHSGFSANYALDAFEKLARFEPLVPLNGTEDEWQHLGYRNDMESQNKRDSRVFRREDGTCYQSSYYIFREPNGACFSSSESIREIESFPYTPGKEFIDRDYQE